MVVVSLDPVKGSEQGKTRPAVVVQNDTGNEHAPTTIVAPLTSSYDRVYPMQVELLAAESDVERDSVVMCDQVRTVSIEHRIQRKLGALSEREMAAVDHALEISLGLDG